MALGVNLMDNKMQKILLYSLIAVAVIMVYLIFFTEKSTDSDSQFYYLFIRLSRCGKNKYAKQFVNSALKRLKAYDYNNKKLCTYLDENLREHNIQPIVAFYNVLEAINDAHEQSSFNRIVDGVLSTLGFPVNDLQFLGN